MSILDPPRTQHGVNFAAGARSRCGTAPGLIQLQGSVQEGHDSMGGGEEGQGPRPLLSACTLEAGKPVWLVCDSRRPTDMHYFTSHYPCLTVSVSYRTPRSSIQDTLSSPSLPLSQVKVCASEGVRRERGWVWREGVDDAPSECALDDYHCHMLLSNEGNDITLTLQLEEIRDLALSKLKSNVI